MQKIMRDSGSVPKSYFKENSVIIEDRESEDEIIIGSSTWHLRNEELRTSRPDHKAMLISSIPSSGKIISKDGESTAMSQR